MAATIGLALDHEEEYGFPRWAHERFFPLTGCFKDVIPEGPRYKELRFCYDPIPYQPNLGLSGFFQSEKYFSRQASKIRSLLTPFGVPDRSEFIATASLHVRRGDYQLLPDKHPLVPIEYYEMATDSLLAKGVKRIIVFSDDLEWCRKTFLGSPYEVIPDMPGIKQLAWTIACEHHVMANSTFSWWGAWLNPNPDKVVIAPREWFGPAYANYDTRDLLPEEWTTL